VIGLASASYGGYAGRAYQILSRNHNNNITFYYTWANGDSSTIQNVININAQHADGRRLALNFSKASGTLKMDSMQVPDSSFVTYTSPGFELRDLYV
jgi:hypothetical protein